MNVIMLLSYTHIDGKTSEKGTGLGVSTYKLFTRNNLDRPYLDGNLEVILETIIYSFNLVSNIIAHQ